MAQDLKDKKQTYMTAMVTATEDFIEAFHKLRQLRQEWTSLGYSGTIVQGDIDIAAGLRHLTPTILGNVWNTYDAIEQLITVTGGTVNKDAGHLTNLYAMES